MITPTRRELLIGAASLAHSGLLFGCGAKRKVTSSVHAGVEFKELVPSDAADTLPLVVAVHGIGGAPEHWVEGWRPFAGRATVALPRGFHPHGEGFSWFDATSSDMNDAKLAADVAAAEERLWNGIAALAGRRRVLVAGFAQGAMLCFAMAARRPVAVVRAFAIAGACPHALLPINKAPAAPLIAFHGTEDEVVPIQLARDAVNTFKAQGCDAELREYPKVRHSPTDQMHADLNTEMQKTLQRT